MLLATPPSITGFEQHGLVVLVQKVAVAVACASQACACASAHAPRSGRGLLV